MKKYFVNYEQALALKDLGFDKSCFATYNIDKKISRNPSHDIQELPIEGEPYYWNNSKIHKNTVTALLYSQAFDWLLQKYSLYGIIIPTITMNWTFKTMTVVDDCIEVPPYNHVHAIDYSTFELSQSACLDELIKLAQNINK